MPAFDLTDRTAKLGRFDVVGKHSETSPGFVRHVALLDSDDCEASRDEAVRVVHMGPPLKTDDPLNADVAGRIPLTNDQINSIKTWIAKVVDEYQSGHAEKRQQYIIDPPWDDIRDENTNVRRYRRYSCAGFVLYAHLQVDVSLLVLDKEALPEVSMASIEAAYPGRTRHRARYGLEGDGPWRIILAGYVLHALDRSSEDIGERPYVAQKGDESF